MDRLDRVESKIDDLDKKLDKLHDMSLKNTIVLEEHQRRSLANEDAIKILKQEFKPVQDHVQLMNSFSKIAVATGATILFLKKMGIVDRILTILQ